MGSNSTIEWTESTWNPVSGCTKISPGCKNCYAERMANRLQAMGLPGYSLGFELTIQHKALTLPLSWKRPQRVFVNSMSDLFHEDVPEEYIFSVFDVMVKASQHQFQVLTKRSQRLLDLSPRLKWEKNIWMGVSVENAAYTNRIDDLRQTGAHIKFLSLEPLLGPLPDINLDGINWAIVGGESGPGSRPMLESWVIEIKRQCRRAGVYFFFKQWGGVNKKKTGRTLRGKTYNEIPV